MTHPRVHLTIVRRVAGLAWRLAVHGFAALAGPTLARWPALARRFPVLTLHGPERLRTLLEELGGSFIKLGQMLALQPDILSLSYCNGLYDLMDRVKPVDPEDVVRTITEDLGRPPGEIFDRFELEPIATASIGQVHAAYLGDRKFAVKVQRPGVRREFEGDVRLMAALVRTIRRFRIRPLNWLVEPLSEFVAWTLDELDFRREARHMDLFHANADGAGKERVPAVVWSLTTGRVLVAEFLEGLGVLEVLRAVDRGDESVRMQLADMGFDPAQFARNVIDNFLGNDFRKGMFHADLHPANLLVLPGNVVGYIDFGITGVLSPYARRHLTALTLGYTQADPVAMCDAFFRISTVGPESDLEGFRRGILALLEDWSEPESGTRRMRRSITFVMLDMLRLSRETRIWPERNVIKYIRSAIAVDGLIKRIAPGFDVNAHLSSVCQSYLRWQSWQELMVHETLVDMIASGGRLMDDGLPRMAGLLERLGHPERPDTTPRLPERSLQARAIRLGTVAVGLAWLIQMRPEPWRVPGANLALAELLILTLVSASFVSALCRMA